jgi:hypothetical protein
MTFLSPFHEKDALEEIARPLYTAVLLCDGPKQEESVKPRFMDDSWYS